MRRLSWFNYFLTTPATPGGLCLGLAIAGIASLCCLIGFTLVDSIDPAFFPSLILIFASSSFSAPVGSHLPIHYISSLLNVFIENPAILAVAPIVLGPSGNGVIQTEDRLGENEHFIERLSRAIPDILYVYDLGSNRLVYLNERASAILGYSRKEFQEMGESLIQTLVHPSDFEGLHTGFSEISLLQDGKVCEHEYRVRHKQGDFRWFHSRVVVFGRDAAGRPDQILGVAHDITERKHIEDALIESESRNASILKALPDLLFVQHEDGTFLEYYARDDSELLVSPDVFLGRNFRDVLPADILDDVLVAFEEAKGSDVPQTVQYQITVDGTEKFYDCRMVRTGRRRILSIVRDITETKETGAALIQSEHFNRSIIDSSSDCIKIVDLDGTLQYMNPKGQELMEVNAADCIGEEWVSFWNDVEREQLRPELEKAKNGGSGRYQGKCATGKGTVKWWDVLMSPIRDAHDNVSSILVVSRDITEQKRVEERLQKKENFFRSLVENAHDIITVLHIDGTIVYESPACGPILGYGPEERIGHDCLGYIHPDDIPGTRSVLDDLVRNGGTRTAAYRYLHKSGAWVSLEVIARVGVDENGEAVVIVNKRDVTDRRKIEARLEESEELYRNVVETQTEMICRFLPDSTLTFVNEAYCRFFNKPRERLVGSQFFELIPEEQRRGVELAVLSLVANKGSSGHEHEVIKADGSIGWHHWTNHALVDDAGNVVELQGIGRDITEEKLAKGELQALSARLLNLQDEERRRLARELHDETAQNLATLNLNLAAIKHHLSPAQERARELVEQSEELNKLSLREVRTLSYLLHPPTLDEKGLASALRWFIQGFSERSGVRVDLVFDENVGRLSPESEMALYRVVQESLTNVHRHAKSDTARVEIGTVVGRVFLTVSDEGLGMPEGVVSDVSGARTLGVGIPGMRERVRLLGGELTVASNGHGTTVTCFIPMESTEQ